MTALANLGDGLARPVPMRQILGWFYGAVLGAVLLVNALFMLISPQAWFRLPYWFPARSSSMTEAKYGSGWGGIEVRLTGAVMLALIVWVLYDMFLRAR
jgi:hypothetical protein